MALPNFSQKAKPTIAVKEISDIYLRKNFQALDDYFQSENQLVGFKLFELSFTGEESNRKVSHGLGYIPQDIVVSKIIGTGKVQFNRDDFTNTQLDVSATGPCVIRFFVGSYWQSKSFASDTSNNIQEFQALLADSSSSTNNSNILILFPLTTDQQASGDFPGVTSTTYPVRDQDNSIFVDCTTSAKTVTLPTAKGKGGQKHLIKKIDTTNANLCTVSFIGSETADSRSNIVLSFLNQSVEIESDGTNWRIVSFYNGNELLTATSASAKVATGSGRYYQFVGNDITLTPGVWKLFGDIYFTNSGASPTYTSVSVLWSGANGADSGVAPAALSSLTTLTINSEAKNAVGAGVNASNNNVLSATIIVTVTTTSVVYLNARSTQTTSADTEVFFYANAERIGA